MSVKLKRLYLLGQNLGNNKRFKEEKVRRVMNSNYGVCLKNLQILKSNYHSIQTKYLKNLYRSMHKKWLLTSENFLSHLERRLDSIVYRSGIAKSIGHASQLISHGKVDKNGKKCDIRSVLVKIGDSITVKVSENHLSMSTVPWLKREDGMIHLVSTIKESRIPLNAEVNMSKVFKMLSV